MIYVIILVVNHILPPLPKTISRIFLFLRLSILNFIWDTCMILSIPKISKGILRVCVFPTAPNNSLSRQQVFDFCPSTTTTIFYH